VFDETELEPAGPEVEAGLRALEMDFPSIRDDYARLIDLIRRQVGYGDRFIASDNTWHEEKRWAYIHSRLGHRQSQGAGVLVFTMIDERERGWVLTPVMVCSGARWRDPEVGRAKAMKLLGLE
jgi:hypothetical protein